MNDNVTTAVTAVTPIRKGNKGAATPTATAPVVAAPSTRGRAPATLKGGKLVSEARAEAKAAIAAAKTALKDAKAVEASNQKQLAAVTKEVDKLNTQVSQLAAAKDALKESLAVQKSLGKTVAQAAKDTDKAVTAFDKANAAAVAIETQASALKAA